MVDPLFQIVTDDAIYTQGGTTDAFKDLDYEEAEVQSYRYEGDFVFLVFDHGLTLSIPESRVKHIAEVPAR